MGLSALQARLLMIVSRMNDIAAEQSSISHEQATLAKDSEQISKEYSDAMSNTKLVINVAGTEGDTYTTTQKDADYKTLTEQGYLAVTKEKEILLQKDADGKWIIPKDKDGKALIEIDEKTGKATIVSEAAGTDGNKTQYNIKDGTEYLNNPASINTAISYGALYLLNTNDLSAGMMTVGNILTGSSIQYVLDTTDDAAALSKYQYETARIERIDNQYDLEMKKLETEVTALNKEYDSINKAIEKNVDRTFGMFENG